MPARGSAARLVALAFPAVVACATAGGDGYLPDPGGPDGSTEAGGDAGAPWLDATTPSPDSAGPSPDAVVLGPDTGPTAPDSSAPTGDGVDGGTGGKSCQGLTDGTPCGPAPDVCHDEALCAHGSCSAPAAKADGTPCAAAPDACHTAAVCRGGTCGAPAAAADGTSWAAGDATAICCSGAPVHANTDSNCGVCGVACNAGNGESCQVLGGHYFCRGCVASAACWSHCCSTSFSPYSCAASDCAGNCSGAYCPPGTHCVAGGGVSSDYCSY